MKVVVTGATGNVGTSTVRALSESAEIDAVVGLARREPTWRPPKIGWVEANVLTADLAAMFDGAAYELLQRVAARAGDEGVAAAAEEILAEERAAADRVAASWDRPDVPLGLAS